ncbi:hypothetical protein NOVOSPHI9U_60243 [Novosphingobium sp. 9U]|nr:hypothetical protein NOVOSPHI9U_60243 [Novosphingobium sp. 9U]
MGPRRSLDRAGGGVSETKVSYRGISILVGEFTREFLQLSRRGAQGRALDAESGGRQTQGCALEVEQRTGGRDQLRVEMPPLKGNGLVMSGQCRP